MSLQDRIDIPHGSMESIITIRGTIEVSFFDFFAIFLVGRFYIGNCNN